jgi:accessory colonization factor AcfC
MNTLRVYGPGGPYGPLNECCGIYADRKAMNVLVTKGRPDLWVRDAKLMGDVVYSGAEFMLKDFDRAFPGIIDPSTIRCPFQRRVGIIVRENNPHHIASLSDLAAQHIKLLTVQIEKMDEFIDSAPGIRENIFERVITGEEGRAKWLSEPGIDAWITYRSWYVTLRNDAAFVDIRGIKDACRPTPMALTKTTRQRSQALDLLDFLAGDESHAVFTKRGWE